mmetsp:Transcript_19709/g.60974  ORF Transcript_19709/g.60974 Transcript_19709/m.60974 type:complete len:358 (+) Transcript_19709:1139-2212(+)
MDGDRVVVCERRRRPADDFPGSVSPEQPQARDHRLRQRQEGAASAVDASHVPARRRDVGSGRDRRRARPLEANRSPRKGSRHRRGRAAARRRSLHRRLHRPRHPERRPQGSLQRQVRRRLPGEPPRRSLHLPHPRRARRTLALVQPPPRRGRLARRLRPRRRRTLPPLRHAQQTPVAPASRRHARLDWQNPHPELRGLRHHHAQPPAPGLLPGLPEPHPGLHATLPPGRPRRHLPKDRHDPHAIGRRERSRGSSGDPGQRQRRNLGDHATTALEQRRLPRPARLRLARFEPPTASHPTCRRAALGHARYHIQVRRRLRRRLRVLHGRWHLADLLCCILCELLRHHLCRTLSGGLPVL